MDGVSEAQREPAVPVERARTGLIHPVVLSGGSGTRLWPLSRAAFPKQLQVLTGEHTMLQQTLLRTVGMAAPLVVCSEEHRFLVQEQAGRVGCDLAGIVLEPLSRNTAPAVATAALLVAAEDPQALLLVQPSDHRIADPEGFVAAVRRAEPYARAGRLVTFGVTATHPETGYGYIRRGAVLGGDAVCYAVERFTEKPDAATARAYCADGRHFWNSGIFLFPVATLLDEFARLEPGLLAACRGALGQAGEDGGFRRLDAAAFGTARDVSIDYAVMEHTDRAALLPIDVGWSDLGSWAALHAVQDRDPAGNAVQGDVDLLDVQRCYVRSEGPLVSAIGVEDLVIVATPDAVLVSAADRSAEVGRVVQRFRQRNRQEVLQHREVHRPWGLYQTVDAGERFQVKRITVKPGASLSLQMHHHRAEHWVVVQGTAKVERDGESLLLRENESIYIPIGSTHRLANPGKLPLHLIEVQSGAYLGEDDIVRFADAYGRLQ